jgi:hypothetical protein
VPEDDHVLKIVASEPLKKGEQMPYHYGWCSSRFFFINYGFCLANYPMDAITLKLFSNGEEKVVLLHRDSSQTLFLKEVAKVLASLGLNNSRTSTLSYALGQV